MRKTTLLFIWILLWPAFSSGQEFLQKISMEVCECIDTATLSLTVLDRMVDSCGMVVLVSAFSDSTNDNWKYLSTVENLRNVIMNLHSMLIFNCPTVRYIYLGERRSRFYRAPCTDEAMYYYQLGSMLTETSNYPLATKYLRKAHKSDKASILIFDLLGDCYCLQKDYFNAIKFYHKSLDIFPEGDVALLGIGNAYRQIGNQQKALGYFHGYYLMYPESPEGYFEIASITCEQGDYENALDWAMIAHNIYAGMHSEKLSQSSDLLLTLYSQLNKEGKNKLFEEKATEYNLILADMPIVD